MKRRLLTGLMIFGLALAALQAQAEARCVQYNPGSKEETEHDTGIIERAAFIGKIKVEDVVKISSRLYQVTLSPVQVYKGALDESVIVKMEKLSEAAWPGKKGRIYERIIFKDGEEYRVSGWCVFISDNAWKSLRESAPDSEESRKARLKCEEDDGRIEIVEDEVVCLQPASDEGKTCADNLECEGFCEIDGSDMPEDSTLWLMGMGDFEWAEKHGIKSGKCSKWKNPKRCTLNLSDFRIRNTCPGL